jgi:hypothetical protein
LPNCIKFTAPAGFSEVRATRHIKRGEPLTICYLEPREQSLWARREALQQFHFTCNCELCSGRVQFVDTVLEIEGVEDGGEAPVRKLEGDIELACAKLAEGKEGNQQDSEAASTVVAARDFLITLLPEAFALLHHCNQVTARICKLICESCVAVLNGPDAARQLKDTSLLLLQTALQLLEIQSYHLGPDHCDCGTTADDISQALALLLEHHPGVIDDGSLPDTISTLEQARNLQRQSHAKRAQIEEWYR